MIEELGKVTSRKICTSQVVFDLKGCVKELVENAIDAGATNIEVVLLENGEERVEVRDNGRGIPESDFKSLTEQHATSKIGSFQDIHTSLKTLGFRGEALSSLCSLCADGLEVITRTKHNSSSGHHLKYDSHGILIKTSPRAREVGTTIICCGIFRPIPVRHREFLRSAAAQVITTTKLLQAYALFFGGIRFLFSNTLAKRSASAARGQQHSVLLSSTGKANSLMEAAQTAFPPSVVKMMNYISVEGPIERHSLSSGGGVSICLSTKCEGKTKSVDNVSGDNEKSEGISGCVFGEYAKIKQSVFGEVGGDIKDAKDVKKPTWRVESIFPVPSGVNISSSKCGLYFAVNNRPIEPLRQITKKISEVYKQFTSKSCSAGALNILVPVESVDVNVTPDKRKVFIHGEVAIANSVAESLQQLLGGVIPKIESPRHTILTSKTVKLWGSKDNKQLVPIARTNDGVVVGGKDEQERCEKLRKRRRTENGCDDSCSELVDRERGLDNTLQRNEGDGSTGFSDRASSHVAKRVVENGDERPNMYSHGGEDVRHVDGTNCSQRLEEDQLESGVGQRQMEAIPCVRREVRSKGYAITELVFTPSPKHRKRATAMADLKGSLDNSNDGSCSEALKENNSLFVDTSGRRYEVKPFTPFGTSPIDILRAAHPSPAIVKSHLTPRSSFNMDSDFNTNEYGNLPWGQDNDSLRREVFAATPPPNAIHGHGKHTHLDDVDGDDSCCDGGDSSCNSTAVCATTTGNVSLQQQSIIWQSSHHCVERHNFVESCNVTPVCEDITTMDGMVNLRRRIRRMRKCQQSYKTHRKMTNNNEQKKDENNRNAFVDATANEKRLSLSSSVSSSKYFRPWAFDSCNKINNCNQSNTSQRVENDAPNGHPGMTVEDCEEKEIQGLWNKLMHSKLPPGQPNAANSNNSSNGDNDISSVTNLSQAGESETVNLGCHTQFSHPPMAKRVTKDSFERMKICGQFNKGFLIVRLDETKTAADSGKLHYDSCVGGAVDITCTPAAIQSNELGYSLCLYVIDQHAADEKKRFEGLNKTLRLPTQPLIVPQKVHLSPTQEQIVLNNIRIFQKNGFSVKFLMDDEIGQRLRLHTIPLFGRPRKVCSNACIKRNNGTLPPTARLGLEDFLNLVDVLEEEEEGWEASDGPSLATNAEDSEDNGGWAKGNDNASNVANEDVEESAESGDSGGGKSDGGRQSSEKYMWKACGGLPRPPRIWKILASRACRSAIMIGQVLTIGQMANVVWSLAKLEHPWNCPHGRPTMRHLLDVC